MKKLLITIVALFFLNFSKTYSDDKIVNKCLSFTNSGFEFCKDTFLLSGKFLGNFSGIKNIELQILRCERFKLSFPEICNILLNKFSIDFFGIFIFIFVFTYIILFLYNKISSHD